MYSENLVKYLLRYQSADYEPICDKQSGEDKNKRPHFGFIYSKMMKNKYASITLEHVR